MEHMAVLVTEVEHARRVMASLLAPDAEPAHWVMLMCPPRLPKRIGRWLTPAQRQQWHADWARSLQTRLGAALASRAAEAQVDWVVALGPLHTVVRQQRLRLGAGLRVLDARRPGLGGVAEPFADPAPAGTADRLAMPVAVASALSVMLALAD